MSVGIAALWFAIRTIFFNITVIYGNLSPASIFASIFYWLHNLYFDIQNISLIPQYFGFWDYFFYLVNFCSPVLSIFLAKIRKDDTPLIWLVICFIFPFAILVPAVLPEKYINIDPNNENCDSCGKSGEIMTYIWTAGKTLKSEVTGVTRSGNTTTTTTRITYGDITSFPTHLCRACYWRKLNLRRIAALLITLTTIIVLISTFKHLIAGVMAAEGIFLFFLIPITIIQWRRFIKSDPQFHPQLFKLFAERKLNAMDQDTIWNQNEYKELKIGS